MRDHLGVIPGIPGMQETGKPARPIGPHLGHRQTTPAGRITHGDTRPACRRAMLCINKNKRLAKQGQDPAEPRANEQSTNGIVFVSHLVRSRRLCGARKLVCGSDVVALSSNQAASDFSSRTEIGRSRFIVSFETATQTPRRNRWPGPTGKQWLSTES